jgi:transposase
VNRTKPLQGLRFCDFGRPFCSLEVAMADLFWLSNEQWAVIEPFMPKDQPGPERKDDRQIISGILHVLTSGCRWRDYPAAYGPRTTVYNRFNRWSRRGFRKAMLAALAKAGWAGDATALDSSYVRVHRSSHGGKEGRRRKPSGARAAARRPRSTRSPTCSAALASCCRRPATPAL